MWAHMIWFGKKEIIKNNDRKRKLTLFIKPPTFLSTTLALAPVNSIAERKSRLYFSIPPINDKSPHK